VLLTACGAARLRCWRRSPGQTPVKTGCAGRGRPGLPASCVFERRTVGTAAVAVRMQTAVAVRMQTCTRKTTSGLRCVQLPQNGSLRCCTHLGSMPPPPIHVTGRPPLLQPDAFMDGHCCCSCSCCCCWCCCQSLLLLQLPSQPPNWCLCGGKQHTRSDRPAQHSLWREQLLGRLLACWATGTHKCR
jgi:hypothetical protein